MAGLYGAFLAAGSVREKSEPRRRVPGYIDSRSVSREVGRSGDDGVAGEELVGEEEEEEEVGLVLSRLDLEAPFRRVGAEEDMGILVGIDSYLKAQGVEKDHARVRGERIL